jgi:hypothetical protein
VNIVVVSLPKAPRDPGARSADKHLLQEEALVPGRVVLEDAEHLDQAIQRDGITMLTTSATCLQLSKVSQAMKFLPGPPGFRIVDVNGGALSTRVIHLHGATAQEI